MASSLPDYANSIASIESGGRYDILGPETKGDRAYGKFQVMGANIPQWTQEALGQSLTPQQFLASPEAQDAVFQFKFGQYVNKYGPEGAAKAWFAGERGMNNPNAKDVLGTSVSGYGAKFMKALGTPNMPTAITPPSVQPMNTPTAPQMAAGAVPPQTMPAYGWSPNNAPAGTAGAQPSQIVPAQAPEPMQMLAMLSAPRRPPDTSLLRSFLTQHAPASPGLRFLKG